MTDTLRSATAPTGIRLDEQNPWPGLASFTEENRAFFHGRTEEIEDALCRIRRERLTVVYGISGLGKTSLLQAGIMPALRAEGYAPVYVRLRHDRAGAAASALVEQLHEAIVRTLLAAGIGIERENGLHRDPEHWRDVIAPGETLWEFFHHEATFFWNERNRLVRPAVLLDQFEEAFTLGRAHADQVKALLDELVPLIENRPPDPVRRRLDAADEAPPYDMNRSDLRLVISLREDYLSDLLSLQGRAPTILMNHQRLLPMNGQQACEAIERAAPALLEGDVARRIAAFVGGAAADSAGNLAGLQVEPSLLSLVCFELNRERQAQGRPRLTADLLTGKAGRIIEGFYESSLTDVPEAVREFIEERLLTEGGHRRAEAESDFFHAVSATLSRPGAEETLRRLVERRLLHTDSFRGQRVIELTHDSLVGVVREQRTRRRAAAARRRELRARRGLAGACAVALLAVGLAAWAWHSTMIARRAARDLEAKQAALIDQQLRSAEVAQEVLGAPLRILASNPSRREDVSRLTEKAFAMLGTDDPTLPMELQLAHSRSLFQTGQTLYGDNVTSATALQFLDRARRSCLTADGKPRSVDHHLMLVQSTLDEAFRDRITTDTLATARKQLEELETIETCNQDADEKILAAEAKAYRLMALTHRVSGRPLEEMHILHREFLPRVHRLNKVEAIPSLYTAFRSFRVYRMSTDPAIQLQAREICNELASYDSADPSPCFRYLSNLGGYHETRASYGAVFAVRDPEQQEAELSRIEKQLSELLSSTRRLENDIPVDFQRPIGHLKHDLLKCRAEVYDLLGKRELAANDMTALLRLPSFDQYARVETANTLMEHYINNGNYAAALGVLPSPEQEELQLIMENKESADRMFLHHDLLRTTAHLSIQDISAASDDLLRIQKRLVYLAENKPSNYEMWFLTRTLPVLLRKVRGPECGRILDLAVPAVDVCLGIAPNVPPEWKEVPLSNPKAIEDIRLALMSAALSSGRLDVLEGKLRSADGCTSEEDFLLALEKHRCSAAELWAESLVLREKGLTLAARPLVGALISATVAGKTGSNSPVEIGMLFDLAVQALVQDRDRDAASLMTRIRDQLSEFPPGLAEQGFDMALRSLSASDMNPSRRMRGLCFLIDLGPLLGPTNPRIEASLFNVLALADSTANKLEADGRNGELVLITERLLPVLLNATESRPERIEVIRSVLFEFCTGYYQVIAPLAIRPERMMETEAILKNPDQADQLSSGQNTQFTLLDALVFRFRLLNDEEMDWGNARTVCSSAVPVGEQHWEILGEWLETYCVAGRHDEAAALMRQISTSAPKDSTSSIWAEQLDIMFGLSEEAKGPSEELRLAVRSKEFQRRIGSLAIWYDELGGDPANLRGLDISFLAGELGNRSWHLLFCGRYEEALSSARRAFELDPTQVWVRTNEAHALVLLGRFDEAEALVRAIGAHKDKESGKTLAQAMLDDLKEFRAAGVDHPDFDRIEKLLQTVQEDAAVRFAPPAYGGRGT